MGTYYQYFPNKEALLLTLVSRHLRRVTKVLEQACSESHGKSQPTWFPSSFRHM